MKGVELYFKIVVPHFVVYLKYTCMVCCKRKGFEESYEVGFQY